MFIKQKRVFKKIKRCIIGVSMTLVMVCTMLPTIVLVKGNEVSSKTGLHEKRGIDLDLRVPNSNPNGTIVDKDGIIISHPKNGIYDKLEEEGWQWDVNSKVLTLNGFNCEVDNSSYVILSPGTTTIELIGNNKIVNNTANGIGIQNSTSGGEPINIAIKGAGTLYIKSDQFCIQSSPTGLSIDNSTIIAESKSTPAIKTWGDLNISNSANVRLDSNHLGIWSLKKTNISNSQIEINSTNLGLRSEDNIDINNSKVVLNSSAKKAILAYADLKISNSSDIISNGYTTGIDCKGKIDISNSKVDSSGKTEHGILSNNEINIDGGTVHAKGASLFTAVSTNYKKIASEAAESKISISGIVEKNNAKILFNDWSTDISWTTFIDKNEFEIVLNENGLPANALSEIWLAEPTPADYSQVDAAISKIPSDLSMYTTNSIKALNDAKNTVVRDKKNTEQELVDNYAKAIENAINALKYKGADYSKVDVAISKIPSDLSIYTNASVKAVNDAKNAVNRDKNITEQELVDHYAKDIEHAIKNLTKKTAVTITSPESGIKIEKEDGSAFDDGMMLEVKAMPKLEMDKFKATLNKVAPGFILKELYDISLMKDGVVVQPKNKVKVSIPLTDELKAMVDLQVVSIDDKGAITIIPSKVKDDVITFTSDHFSYYGVIGKVKPAPDTIQKPDKTTPATGDHTQLTFYVIIALLSVSSLLVITNKPKAR